jgi:hypothetical protein
MNCFFTESIWSEKACQVLCVNVTLVQEAQLKLALCYVSLKMGTERAGEAHGQYNFLIYI